ALTRNSERGIASPGNGSRGPEACFRRKILITNLRRSSTNRKGSITNLLPQVKKKATRMIALKVRNKFKNIPANTPAINSRLYVHHAMPKILRVLGFQFLKTESTAL